MALRICSIGLGMLGMRCSSRTSSSANNIFTVSCLFCFVLC